MFTKKELQVLHHALTEYQGPYGINYKSKKLTNEEIKYHKETIETTLSLIDRLEELIIDLN